MEFHTAAREGDPYRTAAPRLEPPPRHLPPVLALRLLFGGFHTQFGWLVFVLGMAFVCAGMEDSEIVTLCRSLGGFERAPGWVNESTATGALENNRPVFAVEFFFVDRGRGRSAVSHVAGSKLERQTAITVEYSTRDPSYARIVEVGAYLPGLSVLWWFSIIPMIGLIVAGRGWRSGWKACTLLKCGKVGWGRFVGREETRTRVNGRPVIAFIFEFETDEGQRHRIVARTTKPAPLENDPMEQLVYDPRDPRRATMIDHLPGAPRIDSEGRIQKADFFRTILVLALPTIALFEVLYAVWKGC